MFFCLSVDDKGKVDHMRTFALICAVLIVVCLATAGCTTTPTGNATTNQTSNTSATGTKITVSGAFALYPMMIKWTEEYKKIHPEVTIEVSGGGAGKGMTDALNGLADLGMVSREIYPEEIQKGAFAVAVAKDAVVGTINANNPVLPDLNAKGVTNVTLKAICVNETMTKWGDLVGRSDVTDKIAVYTRSDACGAATVWANYMGYNQEDLKGVGVYGDPGLADAVKNDRLGIGYNNIGFAYDPTTLKPQAGLAILKLDQNGNGVIDPSEEVYATRTDIVNAIQSGNYPSPPARELYLVGAGPFTGATKDFVTWILTDGQQYEIDTGFIPLTPERQQSELAKVKG
jgi:phosphate transport system substrate-binding protein